MRKSGARGKYVSTFMQPINGTDAHWSPNLYFSFLSILIFIFFKNETCSLRNQEGKGARHELHTVGRAPNWWQCSGNPFSWAPRVLRCSPWQDPQHSRFQKPELLVDPQTRDTAIIISLQQKLTNSDCTRGSPGIHLNKYKCLVPKRLWLGQSGRGPWQQC